MRGRFPSSTKKLSASKPIAAPVSAQARSSTIKASIAPLAPPTASIDPANAALASVVGRPSRSSAQPAGIGRPSLAAIMTLPRAASDSDRSISSGSPALRGNAAAIGIGAEDRMLATGRRHRRRRIAECHADHARGRNRDEMIGRDAEMVAVGHAHEAHAEFSRPRDRLVDRKRAREKRESGFRVDQCGPTTERVTTGVALPSARPLRRCAAYCGIRDIPCDASPWASAPANARAVIAAMRELAPARISARVARSVICAMVSRGMASDPRPPRPCPRSWSTHVRWIRALHRRREA